MSIDEVEGPFGVPVPNREAGNQLRANELSLFDSTAVAVSSVAPAYSLASTMTFLAMVAGVGVFAPSLIILSFIPVIFVAVAYFHLNRRDPDCGASYSWVSKLTSPYLGWFNGWVQIALSGIFCVIAPLLAGSYTLQFFSSLNWISAATAGKLGYIAVVGALWLALVTFICVWGIRWTTNFQWIMVIIEYVAVVGFSIWGIIRMIVEGHSFKVAYINHHWIHPSSFHFAWLNPLNLGGYSAISGGIVLGVFFFWGWDTALNLNEESKDATHNPGRAGVISMFLLLFIFLLNIIAAEMLLPNWLLQKEGPNILFFFANHAVGSWAGYVMIFAVLSSTVGTTQTTLLPAARITYSMARDKVFPRMFGSIQGKTRTPAIGTLIIAFICLLGIMILSQSQSGYNYLQNIMITSIGVLIGFYYGVTGLTCAWAYRKVAFKSFRFFLTGILFPALSGVALLLVGVRVFLNQWSTAVYGPDGVTVIGHTNQAWSEVITLVLGLVLVVVARLMSKGDFFKKKSIAYETIE